MFSSDFFSPFLSVQLQAPGSTPFMGFLLQAREVGGQSPVGSFALTAGAAQLLACGLRPVSSLPSGRDCNVSNILVMGGTNEQY